MNLAWSINVDITQDLYRLLNSMEHRYTHPHQHLFQEWHWCEDDNYVNIVNDFGKISIRINERIVGRFTIDTVQIPHGIIVEDGDVHTAVLEFIERWKIGV